MGILSKNTFDKSYRTNSNPFAIETIEEEE